MAEGPGRQAGLPTIFRNEGKAVFRALFLKVALRAGSRPEKSM